MMVHLERLSDPTLLRRTRAGNAEAFGVFYRRRHRLVLSYLLRTTSGDAELAADLLAETFAVALAALKDRPLAPQVPPAAWLLTIARNKHIDTVRRARVEESARRELGIEPLGALGAEDIAALERITPQETLLAELRAIPRAERLAVAARVLEEREYRDIAEELGCSEAAVRQRVSRGLKRLRNRGELAR